MRDHLDIAEFEARTKIRAKYLRALEDEEWTLLPGYTFTKAFLRTYADMLGLDGRMLVDEFKRQYQDPSEIELAPVLPSRRDGRRARERPREGQRGGERGRERNRRASGPSSRVLLVAVLVVLLAAALFVVRELSKHNPKKPPARTTVTHTHTTKTHTPAVRAVKRVALTLVPTAAVRVCLIAYKTANSQGLQRVSALLGPASVLPTYHADNRFRVSFTGGAVKMIVNSHTVPVTATGTTVSYEIFVSGHYLQLPAGQAPRCS